MTRTAYLIHGMSVGPWCWDNYTSVLEDRGYRCVAPALPLHDVAPTDPPDPRLGVLSLLDYAAFLEADIRALPEKPVLIGHSMGGLLAQILASRGLARALVLLAPAAPAGIWAAEWSVVRSFFSIWSTWGFWKKPVRQTFAEFDYGVCNVCPPEEREALYRRFVYESGRVVFEAGFWFLDRREASRVDPHDVSCPTLVIAGGKDRTTPAAVVQRVAQRYRPLATYRVFPQHGHWLLGEPGWQEIAAAVVSWLDTKDSDSGADARSSQESVERTAQTY
jgi:pimeloyl-ACP methyl ester carboxylesterase